MKRLRLSFWVFWATVILVAFFVGVGGVLYILRYDSDVLFSTIYLGATFSPVAILVLLVDCIFNKEFLRKYFVVSLIVNIILMVFSIYAAYSISYALGHGPLI
jgi:hypothetical protein